MAAAVFFGPVPPPSRLPDPPWFTRQCRPHHDATDTTLLRCLLMNHLQENPQSTIAHNIFNVQSRDEHLIYEHRIYAGATPIQEAILLSNRLESLHHIGIRNHVNKNSNVEGQKARFFTVSTALHAVIIRKGSASLWLVMIPIAVNGLPLS
ncbi:uncharacterized protein LY89DRAFT_727199 [Mollisia scopiformis]|uniref:Uncharacterized protein n=1 Tax=Mollisia scopiformis TaxID=149040 RepID=A0A194XVW8_MOLSC|nr:uncharacterized protein LY89DRAFT_727199 [Mollisia scopiformis]KUJ24164.1 hypothetical protein LY89DRAFT_727199 [Mollisia scopiformis]